MVSIFRGAKKSRNKRWAVRSLCKLLLLTAGLFQGCGYHLQNSHNPLAVREGIERIYVSPIGNNTYKVGIENIVYNNLIRTLAAHKKVILVQKAEYADAILSGSVSSASYSGSAATSVADLKPKIVADSLSPDIRAFSIFTEYTASLACSFSLSRKGNKKWPSKTVWRASFDRSKPFPASNQLDIPGTTSALINESEFDRALGDLASSMMDDVHESMLAMF